MVVQPQRMDTLTPMGKLCIKHFQEHLDSNLLDKCAVIVQVTPQGIRDLVHTQ